MKHRSFIRQSVLAAALVLTCAVAAHAALKNADSQGTTGFLALATGGIKIEGKGAGVTATEEGGNLIIKAPVNALETGMDLRNKHLKEAIHAEAHPYATLSVPRASLQFPADGKTVETSATGKFTLNGVTTDQKFDYKVTRTGSDYHVQGKAQINIKNHKIEAPSYLGVTVEPNVKIKVNVKLRE